MAELAVPSYTESNIIIVPERRTTRLAVHLVADQFDKRRTEAHLFVTNVCLLLTQTDHADDDRADIR